MAKFEFDWELEEFDDATGIMLIQVNFTAATWISANIVPDDIELTLVDYVQFMPGQARRLQDVDEEEEIKNHTLKIGVSRQMPNTSASQNYDKGTENM